MRKAFQLLFLVVVFSLCLTSPVWALSWTPPDTRPASSYFAGREYTRQHWVDYYLDE